MLSRGAGFGVGLALSLGRRRAYCHSHPSGGSVFLFFSNRLGCAGSLLLSAVLTVLFVLLLNR